MFVITVDFEIKSEYVNEFRSRVLQQAKDSLNNEEKCLIFDVCYDEKNTNKVFLYEIYQNKTNSVVVKITMPEPAASHNTGSCWSAP